MSRTLLLDSSDHVMNPDDPKEPTLSAQVIDLRCTNMRPPISEDLVNSDAMCSVPGYSAALPGPISGSPGFATGHRLTSTIGRRIGAAGTVPTLDG